MKTLYIMRHADKDTSNPNIDDYDIQVTPKGLKDVENVSKKLKEKNVLPDLLVASPALRTKQTAEIVAKELGYTKSIMYNEVLFQAFVNEVN
ncbi:MAG: SixA phosphatase family protein [Halarcobacter ebronensis]